MEKISKIVVGTSLSEASDPVVGAGLDIARTTGCEIHVVHAYPMPAVFGDSAFGGAALGGNLLQPQITADEEIYRTELGAQLERLGSGLDQLTGLELAIGTPHQLVVETAERLGADLLLLGSSEAVGPLAPLLGSTADRVIRKSTRPILVVREGFRLPFERVLAPVDLSPLSEESLGRGLEILEQLELEQRPTIEALFILSRLDREKSHHFTPDQVDRFAVEELRRFLERVDGPYVDHLEPRLRCGVPRQEILAYLEQHPADLLILGTHGRSGFERFILGSVAADLVRRVEVSVLVVPPLAEEGESAA